MPHRLKRWERGLRLESRSDPDLFAFFWFYEWYLFDAVQKGEHTAGKYDWQWRVDDSWATAQMTADWLKLVAHATANGARLSLTIANRTDHDWPPIAALIPCVNQGDPRKPKERNPVFLDEDHTHTYFLGMKGLEPTAGRFPREIHFNHECRAAVESWDREKEDGRFVFDEKWPVSDRDAFAGIMIRESSDRRYVLGVAWDSFLSAQGHNPWNCMHLSVKIGPLAMGETRTIQGRMYLFEGSKADCLNAFENDFEKPKPREKV